MRNGIGKLIKNPSEKKVVTLQHFEHRMGKRQVMDDVEEIVNFKKGLFKLRLGEAKSSSPFSIKELDKVLKSLKSGKSKDAKGYICDMFREGIIGTDLKHSVLLMINRMKN